MELSDLKEIWKEIDSGAARQFSDDDNIIRMLRRKSQNPIGRMRRNARLEMIMIVILYGIAIVYYFVAFAGKFSEISWFMLTAAVLFLVYFFKKSQLLKKMQCVVCNVCANLELQVAALEKYVRFYLITGTLLIPILMLFIFIIFYAKIPFPKTSIFYIPAGSGFWQSAIIWFLITVIITVTVYYLEKWYLKKLYGKHISDLKLLLKEMNEDE